MHVELDIVGKLLTLQSLLFRAEFISAKNAVEVISKFDQGNGEIRFHVSPHQTIVVPITVKNNGENEVTFCKYRKLNKRRELTIEVSERLPLKLLPGDVFAYHVFIK